MKRRDFVVLFGGAAVMSNQEVGVLRSQIATSNTGCGHAPALNVPDQFALVERFFNER